MYVRMYKQDILCTSLMYLYLQQWSKLLKVELADKQEKIKSLQVTINAQLNN